MRLSALLSPQFQTELIHFPLLSYTSTSEIRTLLYIWSLKKEPLSGGASPYGPDLEVPGREAERGGGIAQPQV